MIFGGPQEIFLNKSLARKVVRLQNEGWHEFASAALNC